MLGGSLEKVDRNPGCRIDLKLHVAPPTREDSLSYNPHIKLEQSLTKRQHRSALEVGEEQPNWISHEQHK
jgi:hypothetical protein